MHVNFDTISQKGCFVDPLPSEIGVGVVWSERNLGWAVITGVAILIALPLLAYGFFQHDFQPSSGFRRQPDQWAMVPFVIGHLLVGVGLLCWPRYVPFCLAFGPDGRVITPKVTYTTNSRWIYISLMVFCVIVAAALLTRTATGAVVLVHVFNVVAFLFYLAMYLNVGGVSDRKRALVEHRGRVSEIVAIESEDARQWGWSPEKGAEGGAAPMDVFLMFENGGRHLVTRTTAGRQFATMMVLALKKAHGLAASGAFSGAAVENWVQTMGSASVVASPVAFDDGSVGFDDGPRFS